MAAQPMGAPGCPDMDFCTMSAASTRIVFTAWIVEYIGYTRCIDKQINNISTARGGGGRREGGVERVGGGERGREKGGGGLGEGEKKRGRGGERERKEKRGEGKKKKKGEGERTSDTHASDSNTRYTRMVCVENNLLH